MRQDSSGNTSLPLSLATREFYDFLTYAFFSIQIGHALFPEQSAYGSLILSLATSAPGSSPGPSALSSSVIIRIALAANRP
jgi:hypothetical protein